MEKQSKTKTNKRKEKQNEIKQNRNKSKTKTKQNKNRSKSKQETHFSAITIKRHKKDNIQYKNSSCRWWAVPSPYVEKEVRLCGWANDLQLPKWCRVEAVCYLFSILSKLIFCDYVKFMAIWWNNYIFTITTDNRLIKV